METAKGWQFATPFLRQLVPHALWREGVGAEENVSQFFRSYLMVYVLFLLPPCASK